MNGSDSDRAGTLTKLTEAECLEFLSSTSVGHIAFVNAEGQQLIPVNFMFFDGFIYFRTAYIGLLSGLTHGHDDVAFGVDHHEDASHSGWNVTARGGARQVEDRATINKVLINPNAQPWAGGVRSTVIEVRPKSISGRKVDVRSAEPGR